MYRSIMMILPTQHVMEEAYRALENNYLDVDTMLLLTTKVHRDLMAQENVFSPLDLIDEYIDEIRALVIKLNRDKPFIDFMGSNNTDDVVMAYRQLNVICKSLYNKLIVAEACLGQVLSKTLPDSFYEYRCEPEMARIYAGDLVLKLTPIKSLVNKDVY